MPNRKVLNRVYDREYFSGTQAALYIGDVFVDEVTAYEFEVNQTKTPIYGYASQLFDDVSKGPAIVQGQFSINFKESGYLFLILNEYRKLKAAVDRAANKYQGVKEVRPGEFVTTVKEPRRLPDPFRIEEAKNKVLRKNIEEILNGDLNKEDRFEFYSSLARFATSVDQTDKRFEDLAEAFEDALWKEDDLQSINQNVALRPTDDVFNGFDMYFTYGDFNNPEANHTVERIQGVHLTKRMKNVNVSGEPIQEWYQFFARNSF